MNAAIDPAIFRAYDIRGVVDSQLNETVMRLIGAALATRYPQVKQVALGRDGRLSGERLMCALSEGLRQCGADVLDVGEVPTPALYYAAAEHCDGSGLMVTGSHNPAQYNGVKMMMAGHTLAGDDVRAVYETMRAGAFADGDGSAHTLDVRDGYVGRIAADITVARPLRIVIDCGNGVAGPVAMRLFKALGCEAVGLYCDVDGRFPNHHPNPSEVKNLRDLIAAVAAQGAAIGFAFDGDGDRLGVVDDSGNVIWADRQMMIYARHLLRDHAGAGVVYDVKSSSRLTRLIKACGGKPYMSRTGHSYIKAMLKETGAKLAGEMSGHIFFSDRWYGFDDALYAAARMLEIIAADGRASSDIFSELPSSCSTPELTIDFSEEGMQHDFIERFVARASFDGAVINKTDGLRAEFDNGWGLARASNTTPCLVLRFEGDDEQALSAIRDKFRAQLLATDPSLALDF